LGNGLFIVIEGAEGSGKSTQINLLKERLKAVGYEVVTFDFPQFDKGSSYFINKYLNGSYGPRGSISPYTTALFYALDRFEAAEQIKAALKEGKIVLANRFTGSSMAEQGSAFGDEIEQRSFFVWDDNLEFQLLGTPRPNISIYLRVPPDVSYDLKSGSNKREQSGGKEHLRRLAATYDLLCQLFPKDFKAIECSIKSKLLGVPQINNLIWDKLKPLLPAKKAHASRSVVVTLGADKELDQQNFSGQDDGILSHEFKDASLLLWMHLQRLAPGAVPKNFDGWTDGKYHFYTPSRLPKEARDKYKDHAERLSVLHQQLSQKIAKYLQGLPAKPNISAYQLLQPAIPLGALSSFRLTIKMGDISRVAGYLLAEDQDELQWAAKQLYLAARQKWPKEFEQPLESRDGPTALNNIIAQMAGVRLPQVFSIDGSIKLLEARPRLEFDLLAESVYPYSSLSLDEISEEVSSWPYSQKYQSLKEAASRDETLRKVNYKMDILSDNLTLMKMVGIGGLHSHQVQAFSPRYGYEMPQLVDDAGADDLYDAVFDESLAFYSLLQSIDRDDANPYPVLLGHKLRWQVDANAAEMSRVIKDPGLAVSPVIKTIAEKLAEAHPLLWEVITNGQTTAPPKPKTGKQRVKPVNQPRARKPKKS
jgi:dTMP kinase